MENVYKANDPAWLSSSTSMSSSDEQLHIRGVSFSLSKDLLPAKSSKVAALLEKDSLKDLNTFLRNIPADPKMIELVARFCHGYELKLCSDNVVPLLCVAYYLGMDNKHCDNNLLNTTHKYFEQRVIPSWNESLKAFRASKDVLNVALELGLIAACLETIIAKALIHPQLMGEPIRNWVSQNETEDNNEDYRFNPSKPSTMRRLFDSDWKSEDLTSLPIQLYEPVIATMNQRGIQLEYIAGSVCRYVKKYVFDSAAFEGTRDVSIHKRKSLTDVMEAVERILPRQTGLIPCSILFEMLRAAIELDASKDCQTGFETRIGKQLDQASVNDLLIPEKVYVKESSHYDVERVKRILKIFYENYTSPDVTGFSKVSQLMESFLFEVANVTNFKLKAFISLAEMSVAASSVTDRNHDGIYRAVNIYLEKHQFLTDSEREDVCKVIDFQKMSPQALDHVATNKLLPLRYVVQVLFVSQLQLRETVKKNDDVDVDIDIEEESVEERDGDGEGEVVGLLGEEVRFDMEKMSNKMMELERECYSMKKEIENGCFVHHRSENKGKVSVWGEMKRKFGCMTTNTTTSHDCNSQVKKKKKKVHYRHQ